MSHGIKRAFEYPDDLSTFPKETQRILAMAHDLDWTIRWLGVSHNLACITSKDGEKTINIPRTNVNANRAKSWLKMIPRHTDPDLLSDYLDKQTLVTGKTAGQRLTMPSPVSQKTIAHETSVAAAMQAAHEAATAAAAKTAATISQPVKAARPDDYIKADVGVVTTKPWMVRKGGKDGSDGTMYESPVVIERIHTDGAVDYRCKHCTYTNINPRSVSAHNARKHPETQGQSRTAELRKVHDYHASDIKRPMSAQRRLASEITHILDSMDDWASMDPAELAAKVAEGVYEQRPDREPIADLTPEQIIARIVGLVDRGRLADMHQKVEAAAAALRESTEAHQRLAQERDDAVAEAARLRDEWDALRDLLDKREVKS